jgi:CheY-like chemotaxis protein
VWARTKGIPVPRILVADDNTNIQKMVALAFEERGIDVTSVGNGEAAVRRMPDLNPDLVLADVFMPVRNGYEVCEFVKKDTRFAHIPVILLVGAFDPLDEKEARRVGADGVLKKPFVPPDPLIAMVTSALEKNPKLAAELARAKDTPVMPLAPPEPILESPMNREPVPLPEFPEPTPEEAAQIYGFGKGVRALDDKEGAKEAKAPVGASSDGDDEFDNAATTSDWRRTSGMDLEIPEGTTQESSNRSTAHDFPPITFPSERDVPPRRISAREVEEGKQTVAQNSAPAFVPSPMATAEETGAASRASEPAFAKESTRKPWVEPAIQIPAAKFAASEEQITEEQTAAKKLKETPSQPFSTQQEAAPAARSTEWMEMMSPPPAEYPSGGWLTESEAAVEEAFSVAPVAEAEVAVEAAPIAPPTLGVHAGVPETPVAASMSSPVSSPDLAPARTAARELPDADAPMFAEEGQGASSWFSVPPPMQETIHDTVREVVEEVSAESASRPAPDFGHEILVAPADADRANREGQSESAPQAVAVVFSGNQATEPANGQSAEPSEYVPHQDEVPVPTQHSLPPPPDAEELLIHAEAALVASDSAEYNERIPTAPPPNREAIAGIPFLTPPPAAAPLDSQAIDAVVQRVLERLGPQLNDLLSKGVLKPLIENLLQQELHKNDK